MQQGSDRAAEPFFGFGTMGRRFGGSVPHKNMLSWGQEGAQPTLHCISGDVNGIQLFVPSQQKVLILGWVSWHLGESPLADLTKGYLGSVWVPSMGTEELCTNCCRYFLSTYEPSDLSKCQSDKMGFGERMGFMGFAVGKSKGTDKGRLRQPNPLVNHLMIKYFNIFGFFGPQNLKYVFFFKKGCLMLQSLANLDHPLCLLSLIFFFPPLVCSPGISTSTSTRPSHNWTQCECSQPHFN